MSSTNEIRSTFLKSFRDQGHREVASSPLVPQNDPSLMFTSAGMVQFKDLFLGQEKRDYTRAVTSQKCVRAGGKHNDLENVGYTTRHHTFFEMLGNFSFGDYFKEDAIPFAWNLITKDFGLNKDKLLVTVYHTDEEAVNIWKKVAGLPDDRIIRIDTSDNFWSMGATGPCGPCSEIFYDHGEHILGGPPGTPEEDGDRFIEIWNLVFMQFDQVSETERVSLPKPSIDTGMGLERIAAVLQGKHDNYDIDLMRSLLEASAEASGVDPDGELNTSHRVIADHLRSSAFLIADGVLPSNDGRGYVLRRIMRRAMRHIHKLGQQDPMMYKLVPALVDQMGDHFGELRDAEALITETLRLEERNFRRTLDRGLRLLETETDKLGDGQALPGDVAFRLYDTYGFPVDLTQDILRGENRSLDSAGFTAAMEEQKTRARAAWTGAGGVATEKLWFELQERVGATEFLGYSSEAVDAHVTALVRDGAEVATLSAGESGILITNQTCFYGESGGQVGDTGTLISADGETEAVVTNTTKALGSLWQHHVTVSSGSISAGDALSLKTDGARRRNIRANHSATHLMHEALRESLGTHVAQKGSLVAPDRLRFDFSHSQPVTAEEVAAIEASVNSRIAENSQVTTRLMGVEDAKAEGAMALFGEKYGEEVRVVAMGNPLEDSDKVAWSVELCGGTHVERTGDIGAFLMLSEEGPSSGVRRIEAVTGDAAVRTLQESRGQLGEAVQTLKTTPAELSGRISALLSERRAMEREISELRRKLATGGAAAADAPKDVNGVALLTKELEGVPGKELKSMADAFRGNLPEGVIVLFANADGKASIVISVDAETAKTHSAVDLVRAASAAVGGKGGGGRPDMAQAGGPDGSKAAEAFAAVEAALA